MLHTRRPFLSINSRILQFRGVIQVYSLSVTVIFGGNKIGEPRSNPVRVPLRFANAFRKGMNPSVLHLPPIGKSHSGLFPLALIRLPAKEKINSEFKPDLLR